MPQTPRLLMVTDDVPACDALAATVVEATAGDHDALCDTVSFLRCFNVSIRTFWTIPHWRAHLSSDRFGPPLPSHVVHLEGRHATTFAPV